MPRTRDKNIELKFDRDSRIFVLMGGVSSERDISLKSGAAVLNSLKKFYKNTFSFDIQTEDKIKVKKLLKEASIDAAFIALHGRFGEDGKVQSILEELGIRYTGSGPAASGSAMDKHKSKLIFKKYNISSPNFKIIYKNKFNDKNFNKFPCVVKPARGGSSIGSTIVFKENDFKAALGLASKYDSKIVVEEYIQGREFTVGLLENKPLSAIEIIPKSRYFDFNAKYKGNSTKYIVPANIPADIANNMKELALLSHNSLGCRSFSRVDIMLDKYYNPFILEVNTIPGLTNHSLLPKAAQEEGINFDYLCIKLLNSALE